MDVPRVLSDEIVDTFAPPSMKGRRVPDTSNAFDQLHHLKETKPEVYKSIMEKPSFFETGMKKIFEKEGAESRDQPSVELASREDTRDPIEESSPRNDFPHEDGFTSQVSSLTLEEPLERPTKPNVTVVDYPTMGMVEVFKSLKGLRSLVVHWSQSPRLLPIQASQETPLSS